MDDIPEVRHRSELRYSAPSQVGPTMPSYPSGGGGGGCELPCGCLISILVAIWAIAGIGSWFSDSSSDDADTDLKQPLVINIPMPKERIEDEPPAELEKLRKEETRQEEVRNEEVLQEEVRNEEVLQEEVRKEELRKEELRKEELRMEELRMKASREEQLQKDALRKAEENRLENERQMQEREQRDQRRRELESASLFRKGEQYLLENSVPFTYLGQNNVERNDQLSANTLIQYLGTYAGDDGEEWVEVNAWYGEIIQWRTGIILNSDLLAQNLESAPENFRR